MTVHTCVNCRNSVGLDNNENYFTVSLGSHRGKYVVCYACWLLEPLPAARAVLRAAWPHERGVITQAELERAEDNLKHATSAPRRSTPPGPRPG